MMMPWTSPNLLAAEAPKFIYGEEAAGDFNRCPKILVFHEIISACRNEQGTVQPDRNGLSQ